MSRGDVDNTAPTLFPHLRHSGGDAMEGRRQVDREDRIPLLGGKVLDRGSELNTGIVDENIDPAELLLRRGDQTSYRRGLGHIGAVIADPYAVFAGNAGTQRLDLH